MPGPIELATHRARQERASGSLSPLNVLHFPVRFAWDPNKAAMNRRKHGVSFEEAAGCFADPLALVLEEPRHPERLILIGESSRRRLLFVIYVEREGDVFRIISARKATRAERRRYEEDEA